LLYRGKIDNPNLADSEIRNSLSKQAAYIVNSEGPSGKNIDYFLNLYNFLEKQP
jgi:cation transport regulator ChaC